MNLKHALKLFQKPIISFQLLHHVDCDYCDQTVQRKPCLLSKANFMWAVLRGSLVYYYLCFTVISPSLTLPQGIIITWWWRWFYMSQFLLLLEHKTLTLFLSCVSIAATWISPLGINKSLFYSIIFQQQMNNLSRIISFFQSVPNVSLFMSSDL